MIPIPPDQQIQGNCNQQYLSEQSSFQKSQKITSENHQKNIIMNGKSFTILFIIILIFWAKFDFYEILEKQQTNNLHNFLLKAYQKVSFNTPKQYINIQKAKPYLQLPFCIIIKPSLSKKQKFNIIISLTQQQYGNYFAEQIDEIQQFYTYNKIKSKIGKKCTQYSILFFASQPLSNGSLRKMNQQYQTHNMWMAYSEIKSQSNSKDSIVVVLSMYVRLFRLLQINDFYDQKQVWANEKLGTQNANMHFMTQLFQLCQFNSMNIDYSNVYKMRKNVKPNQLFIFSNLDKQKIENSVLLTKTITRIPYQPLLSLSQQGFVNIKSLLAKRQEFYKSNVTLKLPDLFKRMKNQITHLQFQQLLQIQQLIFLSSNHSLYKIDQLRMEQKYQISKYTNIEKQKPICVTVLSRNNIQNNRYKKAIQSLVLQKYDNFHIVFIDDFSNDETTLKTKQYLKSINFPPQKITFVRNLKQKRITYNYINAGFNFCGQDEIQLIFDGDDQLIGQYVFQFVNVQYSEAPLWVMHSFYKDDRYIEGFTLPDTSDYIYTYLGRRRWIFFFSPLRSWLVKLIRKLPTRQHIQPLSNTYFTTMSDSAIQYGLYEIAGDLHSKYIPQINYLYTFPVNINDEFHFLLNLRRDFIHLMTSLRTPLPRANNLDDLPNNKQLQQILQTDKNNEFEVISY